MDPIKPSEEDIETAVSPKPPSSSMSKQVSFVNVNDDNSDKQDGGGGSEGGQDGGSLLGDISPKKLEEDADEMEEKARVRLHFIVFTCILSNTPTKNIDFENFIILTNKLALEN